MFDYIPTELERFIWEIYYSENVLEELVRSYNFIWENPSKELIIKTEDTGCFQNKHSELEYMLEDHKFIKFKGPCGFCKNEKHWPCNICNNYFFEGKFKKQFNL